MFNVNKIENKIFVFLFLIFSIFIISYDKTFTAVELNGERAYLPQTFEEIRGENFEKFYDSHRDADLNFYHIYRLIERIKNYDNGGSNIFSFDNILGFPIGPEIENSDGIAFLAAKLFLSLTELNYIEIAYKSIDISIVFWTLIAFVVLLKIANFLKLDKSFPLILAIVANPAFFAYSAEATLMSLTSLLAIFLALLGIIHKKQYYFIVLFFSVVVLYRSMDFHMFLYLPLIFLLFTPYLLSKLGYRSYLLICGVIAVATFVEIGTVVWSLDLLSTSAQSLGSATDIVNRSYNPLLLTGMIEMPIFNSIIDRIESDNVENLLRILFPPSAIVFGFIVMVFGLIGLSRIKNKKIQVPIILLLLYWMGPLHYVLSEAIGGPFATESSIRIHLVLYLIFSILSVYLIQNDDYKKYSRFIKILAYLIFVVLFGQVVLFFLNDIMKGDFKLWTAGIVYLIPILMLIVSLNYNKKKILIMALLLLPISNGFLATGMRTFQFHDIKDGALSVQKYMNYLSKDDVVLLVEGAESQYKLHPNMFMPYKVRSINAYINPNPRNYSKLFWYQFYSNKYKEKEKIIKAVDQNIRYDDWLKPLQLEDSILSDETVHYMQLAKITKLVTTDDIILDPISYELIYSGDGMNIYNVIKEENTYGVCSTKKISDIYDLLDDNLVNLKEYAYIENSQQSEVLCKTPPIINTVFFNNKKSMIELNATGYGGIIPINASYFDNYQAHDKETGEALKSYRCNGAFLCVNLSNDKASHSIEVKYIKPSLLQFITRI
jgi:hypothetical protein